MSGGEEIKTRSVCLSPRLACSLDEDAGVGAGLMGTPELGGIFGILECQCKRGTLTPCTDKDPRAQKAGTNPFVQIPT